MSNKPAILCVDDEPMVLEGHIDTLVRKYQVFVAKSGFEGLELLGMHGQIGVVVSDMRMPSMNGAEFLAQVKKRQPTAVRLLLTGQADVESAISAINQGQIFRFLTKPCAGPSLISVIDDAWAQYQLIHAERELLEKTLCGSMETMLELVGLTNPVLHARTISVRNRSLAIAKHLGLEATWKLEVAATMSQLCLTTLPHEILDHLCQGRELSIREALTVAELPEITKRLIGHIPRLDDVQRILLASSLDARMCDVTSLSSNLALYGQILRAAAEFETLAAMGTSPSHTVSRLERRPDINGFVTKALKEVIHEAVLAEGEELFVLASQFVPGMVVLQDVVLPNGQLLAPKGYLVTESLVHRIRNFGDPNFSTAIKVLVPSLQEDKAA
ncbi:MAG TPA: response regulator [Fimbriimonas sp.]|nr:response regulator [Fimbriimonas sp.]